MTLIDLVKICDRGYHAQFPENSLLDHVNDQGVPLDPPAGGDTLALFVVRELQETYDEGPDDEAQVATALDCMVNARDDLEAIIAALQEPPVTQAHRDAVEAALGQLPPDSQIVKAAGALAAIGTVPLQERLHDLEHRFETAGGRGVALAEEIDQVRTALAYRSVGAKAAN